MTSLSHGNRCCHSKKELIPCSLPEKLLSFGKEVNTVLSQAYFKPRSSEFVSIINKLLPKDRQRRSERREAIANVLRVSVNYMDLESRMIGMQTESGFKCFNKQFIYKKSGLSWSRIRRAIVDLKRAGFLSIERINIRTHGIIKTIATKIIISIELFRALGIEAYKLYNLVHWKRKREEKRVCKQGMNRLNRLVGKVLSSSRLQVDTFLKPVVSQATAKRNLNLLPPHITQQLSDKALNIARDTGQSVSEIFKGLRDTYLGAVSVPS